MFDKPTRLIAGCFAACTLAAPLPPQARAAPQKSLTSDRPAGKLEVVHTFYGAMPTGVTVSRTGRIFVNFPRWGDKVSYTVAEIKNGREVPYPNAAMQSPAPPGQIVPAARFGTPGLLSAKFVSVQSVVVDPADRLWVLDTGSPLFLPTSYGGPKLVGIDLKTNRVFKTILFPRNVALPTTYLNDIRFDLRRGQGGVAYITDSSGPGPNALITVDLASGFSQRRLNNHPFVKAVPRFVPFVEGRMVMQRKPGQKPKYVALGADGIAISADGSRLFWCPLASRRLYSVSTAALLNSRASDAVVAATVIDYGEKGMSDGLETDDQNRIYCTQPEVNAISRRYPSGLFETVVHDPRLLWPDTLSVASNGYLYVIANQLHRQKDYHNGRDLRRKPYGLFRTRIGAGPVRLRR